MLAEVFRTWQKGWVAIHHRMVPKLEERRCNIVKQGGHDSSHLVPFQHPFLKRYIGAQLAIYVHFSAGGRPVWARIIHTSLRDAVRVTSTSKPVTQGYADAC